MAEGILRLTDELGIEVFPENPPGSVFWVPFTCSTSTDRLWRRPPGMVLDCAHLAIYQRQKGYAACTG